MNNFYNPRPDISLLQVRTQNAYKVSLDHLHKKLPKVTSAKFQAQYLPVGLPAEFTPSIPLAIAQQMLNAKSSGADMLQHHPVDQSQTKLLNIS